MWKFNRRMLPASQHTPALPGASTRRNTPMPMQSTPSEKLMKALFASDPLTTALREKVRGVIEALVDAELNEVLAAVRYERRDGRRGYRHGPRAWGRRR